VGVGGVWGGGGGVVWWGFVGVGGGRPDTGASVRPSTAQALHGPQSTGGHDQRGSKRGEMAVVDALPDAAKMVQQPDPRPSGTQGQDSEHGKREDKT